MGCTMLIISQKMTILLILPVYTFIMFQYKEITLKAMRQCNYVKHVMLILCILSFLCVTVQLKLTNQAGDISAI